MANAVASVTVTDYWYDGKRQHAIGLVAITNFNYVTNGLALSWAGHEFITGRSAGDSHGRRGAVGHEGRIGRSGHARGRRRV